jgi:hypothetical protein
MEIQILRGVEPHSLCSVGGRIVYIKDDMIPCVGMLRAYPSSQLFPIGPNHFIEVSKHGSCIYNIDTQKRYMLAAEGTGAVSFGNTSPFYVAVFGCGKLYIYINQHMEARPLLILTQTSNMTAVVKGCETNELISVEDDGIYSYQLIDSMGWGPSKLYKLSQNKIYDTPMLITVNKSNEMLAYPINQSDKLMIGSCCHLDYEEPTDTEEATKEHTEEATEEPTDTEEATEDTQDRRLQIIDQPDHLKFMRMNDSHGVLPYKSYKWDGDTVYITNGKTIRCISTETGHITDLFKVPTGELVIFDDDNKIYWLNP